jgi:hypothetical protein
MWYHSWSRQYATSWKVTGPIPKDVTGYFNCDNPSSHTMALGFTQPPLEMNTRNLPGVNGGPARNADLTTICEPIVYKNLNVSQPYRPPRPVTGIALPFLFPLQNLK